MSVDELREWLETVKRCPDKWIEGARPTDLLTLYSFDGIGWGIVAERECYDGSGLEVGHVIFDETRA